MRVWCLNTQWKGSRCDTGMEYLVTPQGLSWTGKTRIDYTRLLQKITPKHHTYGLALRILAKYAATEVQQTEERLKWLESELTRLLDIWFEQLCLNPEDNGHPSHCALCKIRYDEQLH